MIRFYLEGGVSAADAARIPAIKARNLASNPEDYAKAKEAFIRIVEEREKISDEAQMLDTL